MLKSARAFIIFNTLEGLGGDIIYSNPPVEDIEDEKFDLEFTVVLVSKASEKELKSELNNISEIDSIFIEQIIVDKPSIEDREEEVEGEKPKTIISQLEKKRIKI